MQTTLSGCLIKKEVLLHLMRMLYKNTIREGENICQ